MSGTSTRVRALLATGLVVVAAALLLPTSARMVVSDALVILATVALFAGARLRPRDHRTAWYLLGAGMTASALSSTPCCRWAAAGSSSPFHTSST